MPEPCKTVERMEVLLEVEALGDPRNTVGLLDGGPDPKGQGEEKEKHFTRCAEK